MEKVQIKKVKDEIHVSHGTTVKIINGENAEFLTRFLNDEIKELSYKEPLNEKIEVVNPYSKVKRELSVLAFILYYHAINANKKAWALEEYYVAFSGKAKEEIGDRIDNLNEQFYLTGGIFWILFPDEYRYLLD